MLLYSGYMLNPTLLFILTSVKRHIQVEAVCSMGTRWNNFCRASVACQCANVCTRSVTHETLLIPYPHRTNSFTTTAKYNRERRV